MKIRLTENDLRAIVQKTLRTLRESNRDSSPTYKMDVYGEPTRFNGSDVVAVIAKIINKLTRDGGDDYFRLKLFFHHLDRATAWYRHDQERRMETPVDLDIAFSDGSNYDDEHALKFVLIRGISAKYEGDSKHPFAIAVTREIEHKKNEIEYYINKKR